MLSRRADNRLFAHMMLSDVMDNALNSMLGEVRRLSENQILGTSHAALVAYFVEKYQMTAPSIALETKAIVEHGTQTVERNDYGRTILTEEPFLVVSYMFEGDRDLFAFQPNSYTGNRPHGDLKEQTIEFRLSSRDMNERSVSTALNQELMHIQQYLGWVGDQVSAWNRRLADTASAALQEKRDSILARQSLIGSLNIPIRLRSNPVGSLAVSLTRKRVTVLPDAKPAKPYQPEPAVSTSDFDEIMRSIGLLSQTIERSPTTFSSIQETSLRDILLVGLNGLFESATGETFNGAGKTDILIREKNRNVFIAECKVWTGVADVQPALDQLLGYTTWRDSKAALIFFVRNAGFEKVLTSLDAEVRRHPRFKRIEKTVSQTETRYVLRRGESDEGEMIVAVQAFHVRSVAS